MMALKSPTGPFGSVELITNLDVSNPLYLQSNDNSILVIVNVKLVGVENYKVWATAIKIALKGFIDGRIACTDAKSGSVKHTQLIRLMQFLMGDVYQPIRSTILAKDPLPNVNDAFYVVSMEESHRGLHLGGYGTNKSQLAPFDMFNIVDMLTVGHPNGTLAKITAIGSLRLTSGIVFFDVLVVPKYNDLNQGKIMGTGSETGGLYLFDLYKIDLVILLIKFCPFWVKKLGFSKSDHISPCDICHKAKQTRDPFLLSDHKSNVVGDIIHCDVWGPYRVVSKDGYKFFLTLVDDFSRVVWVYLLKSKTEVGEYI
ncbi:ribonuclease H-like domain-containing protein [Tanacetum coccineum]